MTDELIEHVIFLIDSKKGDLGRLNYILNSLQDGKSLYVSDRKYLEALISTHIGSSKKRSEPSIEELKAELVRVKGKLEKYEKQGYRKAIGRKAVFFFITFFFGWHAIITLISKEFLNSIQLVNPYLFPLYQLKVIIPVDYLTGLDSIGLNVERIVILVWGAMIVTWIILGFIYLVKFIRSRYNPVNN